MGWISAASIANLVIVEGAGGGVFVYNGTPAAGNLVASIAAAAGTDSYGNAYLTGITSYGASNAIARLTEAGTITLNFGVNITACFLSASDGMVEISSPLLSADTAGSNLWLATQHGGTLGKPYAQFSGEVVGTQPGTTATPEDWHALILAGGWSAVAGYHTPAYRLNALGNLELTGRVTGAAGTPTTTLPSGYYSASYSLSVPASVSSSAGVNAGQSPRLGLSSAGVLAVHGLVAGTATVDLDATFMLSAG